MFCTMLQAQTACEKIMQQAKKALDEIGVLIPADNKLSDPEVAKILAMFKKTTSAIDQLNFGEKDRGNNDYYKYVNMLLRAGISGSLIAAGKDPSTLYEILSPVANMVYELDYSVLHQYNYVTCTKADDSYSIVSSSEYSVKAASFYYCYIYSCVNSDRVPEAETAFDHFSKYDFGMTANLNYDIAALITKSKVVNGVADSMMFRTASYMLKCFSKQYGYDSAIMPMPRLLNALKDKRLADTTVDDRADGFYEIYKYVKKARTLDPNDTRFTDEIAQAMFNQAMHSMNSRVENPVHGLIIDLGQNDMQIVDMIINMNDPEILNKAIKTALKWMSPKSKTSYFWGSLAKLYNKAGMTAEAEDAEKRFKKYNK